MLSRTWAPRRSSGNAQPIRSVTAQIRVFAWALVLGSSALMAGPVFAAAAPKPVSSCTGSPEGALCDDDNPCTMDDMCKLGSCVGVIAPENAECTDGNQCTTSDRCKMGRCVGVIAADGLACDDDNACTMDDHCGQGTCGGGVPRVCDDGNVCTADTCVDLVGCVHAKILMCVIPDAGSDARPDAPPVDPRDGPPDDARPGDGPGGGGGGDDGGVADGPGSDVRPDGPPAAGVDGAQGGSAGDGGEGGQGGPVPPIRYAVQGGACLCSAGSPAARPPALAWVILVVIVGGKFGRARRRR